MSAAYEQTVAALRVQTEQQARLLEEKDRQILELHALLRDAMRRPALALAASATGGEARSEETQPWWQRWLSGR